MIKINFRKLIAGLVIAAQVLPAGAGLSVQKAINPVGLATSPGSSVDKPIELVDEVNEQAPKVDVHWSVERVDFPVIAVGASSAYYQVKLINGTTRTVRTGNQNIPQGGDFDVFGNCADVFLAAQASCSFQLRYNANKIGESSDNITVTVKGANGDADTQVRLPIRGFAIGGNLVPSAAAVNFGDLAVSTKSEPNTLVLTNKGTDSITTGNLLLSEVDSVFSFTSDCQNKVLEPQQTCSVAVSAQARQPGTAENVLIIQNLTNSENLEIPLSVKGVLDASTEPLSLTPTDNTVSASKGILVSQSYTLRNNSQYDVKILTIETNSSMGINAGITKNCQNITLPPEGTCVITASQTPAGAGPGTDWTCRCHWRR